MNVRSPFSILALAVSLFMLCAAAGLGEEPPKEKEKQPAITLPENVQKTMGEEASRVRKEFEFQGRSLFVRTPSGWDRDTVDFLYRWVLTLPLKIPDLIESAMEQSRMLGSVGSVIMLIFLTAVFYSLLGQKRVLKRVEQRIQPYKERIPNSFYPFFISIIRIVVASLIPLILLGLFSLIDFMISYQAPWILLTKRLLILWTIGALLINILREALTRGLFPQAATHGRTIFSLSRLVVLYALGGIAVVRGAEAFQIPYHVLAFLQFLISISIVIMLFLLSLRKKSILSLIPQLPYRSYRSFLNFLERHYYSIVSITFLIGLLWCFGYKRFASFFWVKTWAMTGVYVAITLSYHLLEGGLKKWMATQDPTREEVQSFSHSVRALLLYMIVLAAGLIFLHLLGLFDPVRRMISLQLVQIGSVPISLWTISKTVLTLSGFFYISRLLQSYLDYKVYPALGVEPGLAYALNTFLKYFLFAVAFFVSLNIIGIDLRVLMVFAGALGIGVGLGLQSMASNIISGFTLVFGRKLRRGDWIQVEDTLGVVTDIYLRATKLRTRDNIEYIIPNLKFISGTIINYTLSSPFIRIHIPVGVTYSADPREVEEILLSCAEKHSLATQYRKAEVFFVGYGDSSINFELLVWIDVRKIGPPRIRSRLYFEIFEGLKKAGIEIPFPQRDLHLRSGFPCDITANRKGETIT